VSKLALFIANADLRRDLEHDNEIVAKDAKLSTAKVKLKVMKADNRLLKGVVAWIGALLISQQSISFRML